MLSFDDSIKRHIGKKQTLCDTDHLHYCFDCVCGVCAGMCIQGLLIQLSLENGGLDREHAGACKQLYFPACYPCVITDGCVCVGLIRQVIGQLCSNNNFGDAAANAYLVKVRDDLAKQANADATTPMNTVQQFCGPCFCTPCHYAAIVRELRPEGYGWFWCAKKGDVKYDLLF